MNSIDTGGQMCQSSRRVLVAFASVFTLFVTPMPAMAAAPAAPLVISGQVFTAVGQLNKAKELDRFSLEHTSPAGYAIVQLARLVESADSHASQGGTLVSVTSTKADASGRYELHATPNNEVLSAAARNNGWVNFLLVVVADGIVQAEGVTRHWNGSTWDSAGRVESDPARVVSSYVTRAAATGKPLQGSEAGPAAVAGLADQPPYTPNCSYWVLARYNTWTAIMEFHNSNDADGSWRYGVTADSDISLGLKPGAGSWSLGGEWHVGNSTGAAIGGSTPSAYDRWPQTIFEYEKIHLEGQPRGFCNVDNYDVVYSKRWLGGLTDVGPTPSSSCFEYPQDNHITRFEYGTFFERAANRALTIGYAANLPFISLSATSGYSTNVQMHWLAARNWLYICGDTDYPPYAETVFVS
jgi:hypothetical protein